jgi:hypothetical protein
VIVVCVAVFTGPESPLRVDAEVSGSSLSLDQWRAAGRGVETSPVFSSQVGTAQLWAKCSADCVESKDIAYVEEEGKCCEECLG